MAEIWKPQSKEVYLAWIHMIIDESDDKLNDWENGFISNIQDLLILKDNLTKAQADKLEQIYVKYTN